MECDFNKLEQTDSNDLLQRRFAERNGKIYRTNSRTRDRDKAYKADDFSNDEKLAASYIAGVMYGDGSISHHKRTKPNGRTYSDYRIKLAVTDREFADFFESALNNIGISCTRWKEKPKSCRHRPMIIVAAQDKESYMVIKGLLAESYIKSMTNAELVTFLKGMFDSEGSVDRITLRISQNHCSPATKLIKYALTKLNIGYKYYKFTVRHNRRKIESAFVIFGNEAKKLYSLFGNLTITRKDKKFRDALCNQKVFRWTDEDLLSLYELKNKKCFSHKEIAKRLKRSKSSVEKKVWRLGLCENRR